MIPNAAVYLSVLVGAIVGRREMVRARALQVSREEAMHHARNAERERIGRDLHDLLGHTLSLISIKSELARKLIDKNTDAARSEIAEIEGISRAALSQVREAVSGIRASEFSGELASAKINLLSAGIEVDLQCAPLPPLSSAQSQNLGMIMREASNNLLRHAQASLVSISVEIRDAQLQLCIKDNGRGFDVSTRSRGTGLASMRERITELEGSLQINSSREVRSSGTELVFRLPLSKHAKEAVPTLSNSLQAVS
jgi:two-component system, NarL family, sensor histidine kinase DesK